MKYTIIYLCLLLGLGACNKKESLDLPTEQAKVLPNNTLLEKKIKEFYEKYDVLIDYQYDRKAFARDAVADPADINDVLPYMEVLEEVFFKALDKIEKGGSEFSKKQTPITILLLGSGINYGGSESFGEGTAGQAGNIQPNRLTLGGLNSFGNLLRYGSDDNFLIDIFDRSGSSFPSEGGQISFIYHEYTHYIDSKNDIPKGFEQIALNEYLRGTNAYRRVSNDDARKKGFMLPYGMQNESEDFATYVHIMVWKPKAEIEKSYLLSDATKTKLNMVYAYYLDLGIDLYKLQDYLHSDELKARILDIKRRYEVRP